jgi:P27 family predicted phage terminase small subunit
MGRRGPAPTPPAIRIAKGETRPSQVNYEAPIPSQEDPEMPPDMDEEAQAVWQHVIRSMRGTGVIVAADRDCLRMYCEAEALYLRNVRLLFGSGSLIRGARGRELIVNPLTRIVREEREAARLLGRELGLSPAARAGLRVDMGTSLTDMDMVLGPARLRVVGE